MDNSEARLDTIEVQMPTGVSVDTDSVPEFLTNLRLSDIYNLPGEYVSMNPEIFSAMRGGNREFLEKIKSYETPMACFKSDGGDSILHLAAASGHLELVKSIVSECPCLLLEPNLKYQIPLHVAARAGHSAVVKAFVASVAYFSPRLSQQDSERLSPYVLKDIDGNTPLHAALKDLHEKAEEYLKLSLSHRIMHWRRSRCISISTSTRQMETSACLVNADQQSSFLANNDGISPLYLEVEAGHTSLVNSMLNRPGDIIQDLTSNLASQLEGRKSLVHAALKAKNTEVLDVILNKDPSLVNGQDEEGRTCLSIGASMGYYKGICRILDRSTKSVYECDEDGSFPIHKAAEKGHTEVVEEILKRCPDSKELVNKQSQNMFHIAAKSGKLESFLLSYIKRLDTENHLIEEQDVDGNTPLHLATINWRCQTVHNLVTFASTKTKILNIQNKDGLRPLDIAELNVQSDSVLRKGLTLMILVSFYTPRGLTWISARAMALRSRSYHRDAKKQKVHINALLVVAALVATVTFTAGLTPPGGFNSSGPNIGMATLANDENNFLKFIKSDSLALQFSILAIIAFVVAQFGELDTAEAAIYVALGLLFIGLFTMSKAFEYALIATINENSLLANLMGNIVTLFEFLKFFFLSYYVILKFLPMCFPQIYISIILFLFWLGGEDDA